MTKDKDGPGRRPRAHFSAPRLLGYTIAGLWTALAILPLLWMYSSASKTLPQFNLDRWLPVWPPHLENFVDAWSGNVPTDGRSVVLPISLYAMNSVIVTLGSLLLTLALASPAAYAIARSKRAWFRSILVFVLIIGLAFPAHGLVLPIWALANQLGLTNTYQGLIFAYVALSLPFAILILAAYFSGIPQELVDAAKVDGCSEFGAFRRVVLPISQGPLVAVSILLINGFWNEFLFSLVLMPDNRMKTLPVGLWNFTGTYTIPYTLLLAILAIAATPVLILYLIFQRRINDSMSTGIIRG